MEQDRFQLRTSNKGPGTRLPTRLQNDTAAPVELPHCTAERSSRDELHWACRQVFEMKRVCRDDGIDSSLRVLLVPKGRRRALQGGEPPPLGLLHVGVRGHRMPSGPHRAGVAGVSSGSSPAGPGVLGRGLSTSVWGKEGQASPQGGPQWEAMSRRGKATHTPHRFTTPCDRIAVLTRVQADLVRKTGT